MSRVEPDTSQVSGTTRAAASADCGTAVEVQA